jgi:hypothetical protein
MGDASYSVGPPPSKTHPRPWLSRRGAFKKGADDPETKKASHPGGISLSGKGIDSSLDDSAKVVGRRHLSPSVAFGTHRDHCSKNDWFMNSQLKERLIYEQSAARTVREQPEKRSSGWSRQPLKIEQLAYLELARSIPLRPSRNVGMSW